MAQPVFNISPEGTALPNDLCAATRAQSSDQIGSAHTIELGGHDWNLFPEEARETFISPSNNDCGTVRSPFLLEGLRDLTIDGQGSRLLVRGSPLAGRSQACTIDAPIVPFIIRDCENVTVRNLSIDWATPGTCQGTCLSVDPENGSFEVELETSQRAWCWNGQLYLEGEGWTWPVRRLLAVDPDTGAILPRTGDNLGAGYDVAWTYEMPAPNTIRIKGPTTAKPAVGCKILFWCSNHGTGARRAPSIFVENSQNVRFENLTLNYCWAMGLIAQNSTDITLDRFIVEPSGDRRFSLAADGAHFVNCRGNLEITRSRFQNQFDDAINAHGLYHQAVRPIDTHTLRIRTLHSQHQGVQTYRPGDRVRLCAAPYLEPVAELTLTRGTAINSETQDLQFETELPASLKPGDFVENVTAYPTISIRNCSFRWNRARGILLNGKHPIRVENCQFETSGSAILVESSASWGEAGPVTEMTIENNTFHHCTTCPSWGNAVINSLPEFRNQANKPPLPKNLPPFNGQLTLRNNTLIPHPDFPAPIALKADSFAQIDSDWD